MQGSISGAIAETRCVSTITNPHVPRNVVFTCVRSIDFLSSITQEERASIIPHVVLIHKENVPSEDWIVLQTVSAGCSASTSASMSKPSFVATASASNRHPWFRQNCEADQAVVILQVMDAESTDMRASSAGLGALADNSRLVAAAKDLRSILSIKQEARLAVRIMARGLNLNQEVVIPIGSSGTADFKHLF
jgi:hypothetical protein